MAPENSSITGQSNTNQKNKSPTKIGKLVKQREDSPESAKDKNNGTLGTLISKYQEPKTVTDSDGGGASCHTEEKKVNVRKLLMKDLLPAVDEGSDQKDFEFDDFPLRPGAQSKKKPAKSKKGQKKQKVIEEADQEASPTKVSKKR